MTKQTNEQKINEIKKYGWSESAALFVARQILAEEIAFTDDKLDESVFVNELGESQICVYFLDVEDALLAVENESTGFVADYVENIFDQWEDFHNVKATQENCKRISQQ